MIAITVYGVPAPQGSKRYMGNGVSIESSKAVKPWRADIKTTIEAQLPHDHRPYEGPIAVGIVFAFPRPKGHYGTGRNAGKLKPSAPKTPANSRNDIDKLARSVLDAVTSAGVWKDDGLVVQLAARKTFVGDVLDRPGAHIRIQPIDDRSST